MPEPGDLKEKQWTPPEKPSTSFAKIVKRVHGASILVRYFTYIVPVALILLIPTLLGALVFKEKTVGGVFMTWFCVWLMVVWLSLWAGRVSQIPIFPTKIEACTDKTTSYWQSLSPRLSVFFRRYSPTTEKNGRILRESLSYHSPCSFGGWQSSSHFFLRCATIIDREIQIFSIGKNG